MNKPSNKSIDPKKKMPSTIDDPEPAEDKPEDDDDAGNGHDDDDKPGDK